MYWKSGVRRLAPFGRYLLFGASNTLVTSTIFVGLSLMIAPSIAYSIAYLFGLAVVTFMSNRWVFRGHETWSRRLLYVSWYLFVWGIGQLTLMFVSPTGFSELLAAAGLLVLATAPLTFFGGRHIFRPIEVPGNSA